MCAKLEVEVGERDMWEVVVEAASDARARLVQIEKDLKKARKLKSDRKTAMDSARVAGALARHLRANAFERWLLETVFERLVEAASVVLEQLSSGEYSFAYDERLNFEVVDHRNADERRSAKTLSGGETFLASLALALTLAEQVAELAAQGSARIESIFLDEGFGSLDPDTLDIVSAAIEELGSRGRMVGLVTHVPELAERVPVQFRVMKGPATSTVEKILS